MCQWKNIPYSQHGMTLILLVFIVGLAATAWMLSAMDANQIKIERDKKTAAALAEAKMALLGWSVARGEGVNDRPGELPCPDNDAPGSANYGFEDGACVSGKIGRLPWKTLGIDELRDGYGETLWYAIDGAFRRKALNNQPINSDTKASMQVYAPDGVNLITPVGSEAVAVIFSAGPPIPGQSRSALNAMNCPATGTLISEDRCVSNYLENANGVNNTNNNGPFIAGALTSVFNDRLTIVSAADLIPLVEKRVAKEIVTVLSNYFMVYGYYPYPAKYDAPGCLDEGPGGLFTDCQSDSNVCRGRFPDSALPNNWGGAVALPTWFSPNLWGQVIYYGVGTNSLNSTPPACSPQLTVDVANKDTVIVMPGKPVGAIVRNNPPQSLNLSEYIEDPENQDGWGALADDLYVTPSNATNDKLYALP